jgi:o-succinylbenzoate synthase
VFAERRSIILELRDENGVSGYGEAAPWPGFGTETADEAFEALERAGPLLGGRNLEPADWPALLAAHCPAAPAARAALEGALWDLLARRAQRPLAEVLSESRGADAGPALQRVPVSALLVEGAPAALREEAMRARAEGYQAAKLKLGAPVLEDDVDRARAVREGLGPQVALRGDANGAWSEREALVALEALARFDFDYVEQPVPAEAIDAMARLRRASPVRIAADESAAAGAAAARVIEAGAADVVVLKPAVLGGPRRALDVAAYARRSGCEVVFTHAFESAIGARHALHCAAAWGDPAAIHGLATQGLFVRDVAEPVACRDGAVEVSREPGLGVVP